MIDGHIHFHNQPYTIDVIDKMVEVALSKGLDSLYLLDHTHKFKEFMFLYSKLKDQDSINFYESKNPIDIKEYLDFIKLVKTKSYPIKLYFGLEVCYSKDTEDEFRRVIKNYDFDFLIGSIHFVDGVVIDMFPDMYDRYDVNVIYKDYFLEVINSIKSGLFTFIGHPDLIKRFDIYPNFDLKPYFVSVAKVLNEYNMETENNTGLLRYGYPYGGLMKEFVDILIEYNVKFHKSSDAHTATDIGRSFDTIVENLN